MHNCVALSASVMCVDWLNAGEQLIQIENNGIDYLHLDIIDGNFAPDFTMGSSIIDVFRENSTLPSDYHLMVEEPGRMFESFSIGQNDNYHNAHLHTTQYDFNDNLLPLGVNYWIELVKKFFK